MGYVFTLARSIDVTLDNQRQRNLNPRGRPGKRLEGATLLVVGLGGARVLKSHAWRTPTFGSGRTWKVSRRISTTNTRFGSGTSSIRSCAYDGAAPVTADTCFPLVPGIHDGRTGSNAGLPFVFCRIHEMLPATGDNHEENLPRTGFVSAAHIHGRNICGFLQP
jgi:hypothetical protein